MSPGFNIGNVHIDGHVLNAPMTGVSDLPFRRTASKLGAPYVATEMVACELLASGRADVVRRAAVGKGLPLMVVQLVGRDASWIARLFWSGSGCGSLADATTGRGRAWGGTEF